VIRSRVLFGLLATAGLAAVAAPARADYCRTKACDDQPAYDDVWQKEPDHACIRDAVGCLIEGQPLYWPQSCISFSVQRDGSDKQGIDYDTAHAVIQASFDAWLSVDCGDGAIPGVMIADYSPANCSVAEYNQDQGNANIFMFRDGEWPYYGAEDTLALTTITYNTENAQIYDADVEINSADASFTTTDVAEDMLDDLQSVLTHECGHFLGLSHDNDPAATMYPEYQTGDFHQRLPSPQDIAGMCEIYPPSNQVSANACTPRHGFQRDCGTEQETGCGVTPSRSGTSSLAGFALLLGLGALLRRSRRR
jgi:MYXO-CTERM domain-containing protein